MRYAQKSRADYADTLLAIRLLSSYSARAHTSFAQALLSSEGIANNDDPPRILLNTFAQSITSATSPIQPNKSPD